MQPVAANAPIDSRSGIEALVRLARRVTTTLWETVGIVSSRPASALPPPRATRRPGTISKERSRATHQSICSWIAP